MIKQLFLFCGLLLFAACKQTKTVAQFKLMNETGYIEKINDDHKNKPLVVVIPALYKSIIGADEIKKLAKSNRVHVVHFPSDTNLSRLVNIDNLNNRTTFYSNWLTRELHENDSINYIISEGLNANIVLGMAHNYGSPKLVFVNAWYPNIKDIVVKNCYIKNSWQCDSLLSQLNFTNRATADVLFGEMSENLSTNLYGYFMADVWKDYLTYDTSQNLSKYKNEVSWIYTKQTGLISKDEYENLISSFSKRKNVQWLNQKEYEKLKSLLSN